MTSTADEPSEQPPMPAPSWAPSPPLTEQKPDGQTDETPLPDPDEAKITPTPVPSGL